MSRSARLLWVAAVALLSPATAFAIATDDLKIQSALNEPLRAEIELSSVSAQDLKTLKTRLVASPDVDTASYDGAPISRDIRVTLVRQPDGRTFLEFSSDSPVREPFVHFLLQLDWAGGRLVREFTALIDPPNSQANTDTAATLEAGGAAPQTGMDRQAIPEANAPIPAGAAVTGMTPEPAQPKSTSESTPAVMQAPAHSRDIAANVTSSGPAPKASTADSTQVAAQAPAKSVSTPTQTPQVHKSAARPIDAEHAAHAKPSQTVQEESSSKPQPKLEKQRLESDIRKWAQTRARAPGEEPADSVQASSAPVEPTPTEDPAVRSSDTALAPQPEPRLQRPAHPQPPAPTQKRRAIDPPTVPVQQPGSQWLVAVVALLAGLVLALSAFVLPAYMRQRRLLDARNQAIPEPERRGGQGRRREFLPVAIERRRGPRRGADQLQPVVASIYSDEEAHLSEPLNSDTTPDRQVEKILQEAIALNPDHHALKVKLLALYYQRDDKDAFESLVNQLYSALEIAVPESIKLERVLPHPPSLAEDTAREALDSKRINGTGGDVSDEMVSDAEHQAASMDGLPREQSNASVSEIKAAERELRADAGSMSECDSAISKMDVPLAADESTERRFEELAVDPAEQDKAKETPSDDMAVSTHGIEVLHVDDFTDIQEAVERGMAAGGGARQPAGSADGRGTSAGSVRTRSTKGKRKRKGPGRRAADAVNARRRQWQDPAIKIDLAKAYIDMGEAERARAILDEVLQRWHDDDATGS